MKRQHRPPVSAARATLRRLRWLLAALFTVINALGLLLFAWLAVREDAETGRQHLDGDLQRVTLAAIQRLDYSADAVSLTGLANSALFNQCPSLAVLPGGAPAFLGLQSTENCITASLSTLNDIATQAVRRNRIVVADGTVASGPIRMLAEPFYRPGGKAVAGAVVATIDSSAEHARHERMVIETSAGCALIILALSLAGYAVAGRAIRPAANTLEQRELFLAESAHDLRKPISALRALAETALHNPSQRAEILPRTVSLAQRMGTIVNDLLTRARLAAGVAQVDLQPVRLDQLVADIVENTPAEDARITLEATESTVVADPALLPRAIGNLLDNAMQHGHRPGEPAVIEVTVRGGRVLVADQGPGMRQPLEAEPFTHGHEGSTGLGLSIVRWIAEAHGGSLRVHNSPTGGAIFELVLPES